MNLLYHYEVEKYLLYKNVSYFFSKENYGDMLSLCDGYSNIRSTKAK